MASFEFGETIICNVEIRRQDNNQLYDPATSIKIDIWNPNGVQVVSAQTMNKDGVGLYHYDYNPAAGAVFGSYGVRYVAVDNLRTSIHRDTFSLHG